MISINYFNNANPCFIIHVSFVVIMTHVFGNKLFILILKQIAIKHRKFISSINEWHPKSGLTNAFPVLIVFLHLDYNEANHCDSKNNVINVLDNKVVSL